MTPGTHIFQLATRPPPGQPPRRSKLLCTPHGLSYGGKVDLVTCRRDPIGRRIAKVRAQGEIEADLGKEIGLPVDISSRMNGLKAVAQALERDEQALAVILALHLKLPDLPERPLAKFDEAEPRDELGRWTLLGLLTPAAARLVASGAAMGEAVATGAVTVAAATAALAGAAAAAVGLYPKSTNGVSDEAVPGMPDLEVHIDQGMGRITIRRQKPDGSWEYLGGGRYRTDADHNRDEWLDDEGRQVAVRGSDGKVYPARPLFDPNSKERICPPLVPEGGKMSAAAGLFQWQQPGGATPGWAFPINGVGNDACLDNPQYLGEAKAEYAYSFQIADRADKLSDEQVVQAQRQNFAALAAGWPIPEWRVKESKWAEHLRQKFNLWGLRNRIFDVEAGRYLDYVEPPPRQEEFQ